MLSLPEGAAAVCAAAESLAVEAAATERGSGRMLGYQACDMVVVFHGVKHSGDSAAPCIHLAVHHICYVQCGCVCHTCSTCHCVAWCSIMMVRCANVVKAL
jgi:hypothetical protein